MYRREHQVELEPKQIETEEVISYIISNQYFLFGINIGVSIRLNIIITINLRH